MPRTYVHLLDSKICDHTYEYFVFSWFFLHIDFEGPPPSEQYLTNRFVSKREIILEQPNLYH
jgi:hypothetical protein